MNLEIRKPELVRRVNAEIQIRHLHDADELLEQALDALNEKSPARRHRQDERASWRCLRRCAA